VSEPILLVLPATITTREARDTQRMLTQTLQQSRKTGTSGDVVVDASGLQHFDSAALAVLLECQRQAQAFGQTLAVRQAPAKLQSLARLYGVAELLLPEAAPAA
jgi:phospholipid transport system transporter-binding protein